MGAERGSADDQGAAGPAAPATLGAILAQRGHAERDAPIVAVDAVTAQWVLFRLGERPFAFPGRQVIEILRTPPIHFVPGCPPALEGVIEVRGTIWSVLRLADLLDVPAGAVTRRNAILLGRAADLASGLRVDAVDDVLELAANAVLAPPADLPGRLQGVVTGVLPHRGQAVLALDLEVLLRGWRDAGP